MLKIHPIPIAIGAENTESRGTVKELKQCYTMDFQTRTSQLSYIEHAIISYSSFPGKNDGSVKGVRYFTCSPKHGVFVRHDKVQLDKRGRALRSSNSSHSVSTSGAKAEQGKGEPSFITNVLDKKLLCVVQYVLEVGYWDERNLVSEQSCALFTIFLLRWLMRMHGKSPFSTNKNKFSSLSLCLSCHSQIKFNCLRQIGASA